MEKIESVRYSRVFLKQLSRAPSVLTELVQEKERVFKENPFDPRLDTHKLHGKDKDAWAFSVSRTYRIMFFFLTDREALFLEFGTHDIYS